VDAVSVFLKIELWVYIRSHDKVSFGSTRSRKKIFKPAKGPASDNGYSIVHEQMKLDAADASLTNTSQLQAQWAPVLLRTGVTVPKYRHFKDLWK
jgi:hypothetical protein